MTPESHHPKGPRGGRWDRGDSDPNIASGGRSQGSRKRSPGGDRVGEGGSTCRVRPVWVPGGQLGRALRMLRWEACQLLGEHASAALTHTQVILADTAAGPLADPRTAVLSAPAPASARPPAFSESADQPRALLIAAAGQGSPELSERVRELLGAALTHRRRAGRPALVALDTAAVTDWSTRLVRVIANLRVRLLITGAEVWLPNPHPALIEVIDPATRWSETEDPSPR